MHVVATQTRTSLTHPTSLEHERHDPQADYRYVCPSAHDFTEQLRKRAFGPSSSSDYNGDSDSDLASHISPRAERDSQPALPFGFPSPPPQSPDVDKPRPDSGIWGARAPPPPMRPAAHPPAPIPGKSAAGSSPPPPAPRTPTHNRMSAEPYSAGWGIRDGPAPRPPSTPPRPPSTPAGSASSGSPTGAKKPGPVRSALAGAKKGAKKVAKGAVRRIKS